MTQTDAPDLAHLATEWTPEPLITSGTTPAWSVGAFSAMLNLPTVAPSGHDLPPLWHWFGFLDHPQQDELGDDGHPAEGRFMPPIPHRRRMLAGGRLTVSSPMRVDERLERRSSMTLCEHKSGRSGQMLLVTVQHEFLRDGSPIVVEEQDVVYRSQPPGQARGIGLETPKSDSPDPSSEALTLAPDPAMLFRFSSLTYNTHRIHYDEPYVTQVEGYPGLVVHGPLLALMLLEIPRRHRSGETVRRFDYRLSRPVFSGQTVTADHSAESAPGQEMNLVAGVLGAPNSISGTVAL